MATVPEDISVQDYFLDFVPENFGKELQESGVEGLEGTELNAQFEITGEGGGTYTVNVKDGKEVTTSEGPADGPNIAVTLDVDAWRDAVTGKLGSAADLFTDITQLTDPKRLEAVNSLQGTVDLVLTKEDGSTFNVKLVFNTADSPSVEISSSVDVWGQIMSKETDAPRAFMSGQLAIKGDMPFALSLNQFMS